MIMKKILTILQLIVIGLVFALPSNALAYRQRLPSSGSSSSTNPSSTSANSTSATSCGNASKCQACKGLTELDKSQDCSTNGSGVKKLISVVVNILSWLVGIIAIIMIIISGIKFATAGGEPNKVTEAKQALVWAMVGLAVAALAQVLVHWTLNTSSKITSSSISSIKVQDI